MPATCWVPLGRAEKEAKTVIERGRQKEKKGRREGEKTTLQPWIWNTGKYETKTYFKERLI